MTGCRVTEAAASLRCQLQGQSIPDDFKPEGAYWEVMLEVRGRFTNYAVLRDGLPDCPSDCPIARMRGGPVGPGCFNLDQAHDHLRTAARWLSVRLFDAWQLRHKNSGTIACMPASEQGSAAWDGWMLE